MRGLADIRKVALLACITSLVSLIAPLRSLIARLSQLSSEIWRTAPLTLLVFLNTALLPFFYFALYRDKGHFQVSARLRLLARTAAFILGILLAFELAGYIQSQAHPLASLLGELPTIATILLLVALSRNSGHQSEEAPPVSALLYMVTKLTVWTWGGWAVFNLLRVLLLPYVYSQTRDYLLSIGRDRLILADMTKEVVSAFLSQACLWIAPYIVYRSRVRRPVTPPDTSPAFPDLQNPPPS
jgi:hypothetical protein